MSASRLVVLESFAAPRSTTNPHMVLLADELRKHVDVQTFSWRYALTGRYEVFHLHWPEAILARPSKVRQAVVSGALAVVLTRARLRRVAIVRTLHNQQPHEQQPTVVRAVLALADRWTTWWITLNRHTRVPQEGASTLIPLGDYGTWYGAPRRSGMIDGLVVAVGQIRAYKNLGTLIGAVRGSTKKELRLVIAGSVVDPEVGRSLQNAAGGDPRIDLRFGHQTETELGDLIGEASLVALPYREMLNSGAVLLALTLGRPVLVPDTPVMADLAAEVGTEWVRRFEGTVEPADVEAALSLPVPESGPDMSQRDWRELAERHVDVFRAAVGVARPGPPRGS